jgi:hypothetical protein
MPLTPPALLGVALCEVKYSPCGYERVAWAAGPRAAARGVAGTLVGGPMGRDCARAVLRLAVKLPW